MTTRAMELPGSAPLARAVLAWRVMVFVLACAPFFLFGASLLSFLLSAGLSAGAMLTGRRQLEFLARLLQGRAYLRFVRSLEAEPPVIAGAAHAELQALLSPDDVKRYGPLFRAMELCAEERWAEARGQLESLDRASLPSYHRPSADLFLAFALAHTGETQRAVELARATVGSWPEKSDPPAGWLSTLGTVLALDRRFEEAVPILRRCLGETLPPRPRARVRYYLGVSLTECGYPVEAKEALEAAAAIGGRYGERARERMRLSAPLPYR